MQRKTEISGFILCWFAVIAQFILMIQNRQADIAETIIRFFSFFTILTNILVALFFTAKISNSFSQKILIFNQKNSLIAVTTFIVIVGFVYQVILRGLWSPKGMQRVVDELLHTIIPLLVLIYWFIYSPKEKSKFSQLIIWLLYPLIYLILVLVRGKLSNYFPYPFLNFIEIGISQTIINCIVVLLLILAIMGILIFIQNKKVKN
ncbi:Pr6Pr family membrane protein [Halpernia sp. GG3]